MAPGAAVTETVNQSWGVDLVDTGPSAAKYANPTVLH
jgi:hypothetical protein